MYGLNLFTMIIVIGIFYFVSVVSKEEALQQKVIMGLSISLLLINGTKLILMPSEIPVEFSTVTYFIAPIIFLLRINYMISIQMSLYNSPSPTIRNSTSGYLFKTSFAA